MNRFELHIDWVFSSPSQETRYSEVFLPQAKFLIQRDCFSCFPDSGQPTISAV